MAVKTELGNIQIFFGQVVDVDDPTQSLRCRVAIQGKTDQIEKEKLPWYYSWNGIGSLPKVNDEVPVIIFDGNFATGMYGKTMINGSTQTAANYKDYVEVFKKITGDSDASITYSISNGIEIKNSTTGLNASALKLKLFCGANEISITDTSILLGSEGLEAMLMGDKTIAFMNDLFDYLEQLIKMMFAGFQTIMTAALPNPYTSAIGSVLSPYIVNELQITMALKILRAKLTSLQSKHTFNS